MPTGSQARSRTLLHAVAWGAVAKVAQVAVSLIQVPIALALLGSDQFGIWVSLAALQAALSIVDLGVGFAFQNQVTHAVGSGRPQDVSALVSNALAIYLTLIVALVPMAILASEYLDWGSIFKLPAGAGAIEQIQVAVRIQLLAFSLSLPLTLSQKAAAALQLNHWISGWQIVSVVLTLGAVTFASQLQVSLSTFIGLTTAPPIVCNLGLAWAIMRRFDIRIRPSHCSRTDCRPLLKGGFGFLLPQLGALSMNLAPIAVINSFLGPSALVPYNIVQRLLSLPTQVLQIASQPLWPAVADAKARGDYAWVKSHFRRHVLLSAALGALTLAGMGMVGRTVIEAWTSNPGALPTTTLILSQALWFMLTALAVPPVAILNGLGQLRGQITYGTVTCICAIAGMLALASRYGAVGVVLAQCGSYILIALPLLYRQCATSLERRTNS